MTRRAAVGYVTVTAALSVAAAYTAASLVIVAAHRIWRRNQ